MVIRGYFISLKIILTDEIFFIIIISNSNRAYKNVENIILRLNAKHTIPASHEKLNEFNECQATTSCSCRRETLKKLKIHL